jgi:hypothetical protein
MFLRGISIPLLHVLWWIHVYKCRLVFRSFFPTSRQFRESGASPLLFIDQFEFVERFPKAFSSLN